VGSPGAGAGFRSPHRGHGIPRRHLPPTRPSRPALLVRRPLSTAEAGAVWESVPIPLGVGSAIHLRAATVTVSPSFRGVICQSMPSGVDDLPGRGGDPRKAHSPRHVGGGPELPRAAKNALSHVHVFHVLFSPVFAPRRQGPVYAETLQRYSARLTSRIMYPYPLPIW